MATLEVSNLNLTFTSGPNAVTINPAYFTSSNNNLGIAGYTTSGNTTIDTLLYTAPSNMNYNSSFDFNLTFLQPIPPPPTPPPATLFTVTFTMSSSIPGIVNITNILISGTTSNVTSCILTYLPSTSTSGPGYQLQYFSSNDELITTDTVIYTTPNNVATYTYTQTNSNDTLLYFDTLMLGINAIYDAIAGSTQIIPEYAGFIDLAMSGLYNSSA